MSNKVLDPILYKKLVRDMDIELTLSAEERPNCWAVWVNELAFYAYGSTKDKAINRVGDMLESLAASFGDALMFKEYLQNHGVHYITD